MDDMLEAVVMLPDPFQRMAAQRLGTGKKTFFLYPTRMFCGLF